jgi:hypothetical protein
MSEPVDEIESKKIDLPRWREEKRADQSIYIKRQASEIILFAIALCPELQPYLLLKGGTLMGIAYDSPRQTVDIDFTMTTNVAETNKDQIRNLLNHSMKQAAAHLGNSRLELTVQHFEWEPKPKPQAVRNFPALVLKIGYAVRGTSQHVRLLEGKAATVVEIDVSFNEPRSRIQILELDQSYKLFAYSWIELIAEKSRALLQQTHQEKPQRKPKFRRQDIYDIDRLITNIDIGIDQKAELVLAIQQKCLSRGIRPTMASFDDPKLKELSGREWSSLGLELDQVPLFDDCFSRVTNFYKSLPWLC